MPRIATSVENSCGTIRSMLTFAFRHHVAGIGASIGLVLTAANFASTRAPSGDASAAPAAQVAPAPGQQYHFCARVHAAPMSAARVIEVLDQTVDWDRMLGVQQKAAK